MRLGEFDYSESKILFSLRLYTDRIAWILDSLHFVLDGSDRISMSLDLYMSTLGS